MKAFLMYPDRDFDPDRAAPVNAAELTQDLELGALLDAMSRGDVLLRKVTRTAVLSSLVTPGEILYRQNILHDCLRQPLVVRSLYDLAVEAVAGEKAIFRSFFSERPETLLGRSVKVLEMFVGMLKRLRQVADEHADEFSSEGFTRFYLMLSTELDDDYFAVIEHHLKRLRFHDGLLTSSRLGEGNQGIDDVLREPREQNRGFFKRVPVKKPAYSMTIPDRDDNGLRALSDLRDRGLNVVANAAAQSADHVLSFFTALRDELAFYVACLNLHELLVSKGEPACFPVPTDFGERVLSARGLYEPCLSLRLDERATGNDLDADGKSLIMITGANQGGKSTFLRSVGVAQLMMQAGMFVAAETFSASAVRALFTHYKREEGRHDDQREAGRGTQPDERDRRPDQPRLPAAVQRVVRRHERARGFGDRAGSRARHGGRRYHRLLRHAPVRPLAQPVRTAPPQRTVPARGTRERRTPQLPARRG